MQPEFSLFDHTADVGVNVWAPTLAELVRPAGDGLYAVIGELVAAETAEAETFDLKGDEAALLLRDYIAELLHRFERQHLRATEVDVEVFDDARLAARCQFARVDMQRSQLEREVKAITYHRLEIKPVAGGFQATYIVDI